LTIADSFTYKQGKGVVDVLVNENHW